MINFKEIRNKDVIILDDNFSKINLKNISFENVNLNSINFFCAIKTILKYFQKQKFLSLKEFYKQNLYRMYEPKLAISHDMNKRALECKYLCPEIKSAIYQFAYSRKKYDLQFILNKFKRKSIKNYKELIDYIFVYHKYEKLSLDFDKSKIFITGSIKNNEINLKKFKKDKNSLLLISEFNPKFPYKNYFYKNEKLLIKMISEFCETNNLKLKIAFRSFREDKKIDIENEYKYYDSIIKNRYEAKKIDAFNYASTSEIIVCMSSNLGIELLSRKFKVFFILIKESKKESYPYLPKKSVFVQRTLKKIEIFKKLKRLLKCKSETWKKLINNNLDNLVFDQGNKILNKQIKTILNQ